MNVKGWKDFSDRDQIELTKMIEEMQKLKAPKRIEEHPEYTESHFGSYEFYLGRGKQFRVVRIK